MTPSSSTSASSSGIRSAHLLIAATIWSIDHPWSISGPATCRVKEGPGSSTSVNIRIDEVLLQSIDQAASAAGMDRSNWMRLAFTERLRGRGPEMVDQIEVVDERARDIVKDMLSRLERLETKVFPSDPFDA